MEADDLLNRIQDATHPHGHVLVHVVDTDYEYWLDITDVKPSRPTDPGWVDGVVLEARPIRDGVRARRAVFTPRPFFQPALTIQKSNDIVELPEEFRKDEHLDDVGPREEPLPNTMAPGFPDDVHVPRIVQKIMDEQKPIASYVHEEDGAQVDLMGIPEGTEAPERFLGPDGLLYIRKPSLPEPGHTEHFPAQDIPFFQHRDRYRESGMMDHFPAQDLRFQQYRSPFQQPPSPLPQDQDIPFASVTPDEFQDFTDKHGVRWTPMDQSEPHYEAARELNTRQVNDIIIENTQEEFSKEQEKEKERARRNLEHQLNERSLLPRSAYKIDKDTSTDESKEQ